jgi:DAK2 domain fusion protein YloV
VEERIYDGQTLKQAYKAAELVLEKRIEEVNSLNVFPVPDGDTGINMYLTLQAANEAVKDNFNTSASEIASKTAMGALLGARGNSGVILSQILRGLAKGLENKDTFTACDFAQALQNASATAYRSLEQPVEGTILTVIREASDMAIQQAKDGADFIQLVTAITSQARHTVARTPEILPTLKDAGVVDAGGKGLFYIFLGMRDFIVQRMNPVKGYKVMKQKVRQSKPMTGYGYDLQFLIDGKDISLDEIKTKLTKMGESLLVVGDENLIRVHIHTHISQEVMDYCATKGRLKYIINDNMDDQLEALRSRKPRTKSRIIQPQSETPVDAQPPEDELRDSTLGL